MSDADIDQANLTAKADAETDAREAGKCAHGSSKGSGPCVCRECGQEFDSFEALLEARWDALEEQ